MLKSWGLKGGEWGWGGERKCIQDSLGSQEQTESLGTGKRNRRNRRTAVSFWSCQGPGRLRSTQSCGVRGMWPRRLAKGMDRQADFGKLVSWHGGEEPP